jgi:hypothetical protein
MTLSAGGPPVMLTAPGGSATTRVALLTAPGGTATSVVVAAASTGGTVSSTSSVFPLAPAPPAATTAPTAIATTARGNATATNTSPTLGALVPTEWITWSAAPPPPLATRSLAFCYVATLLCSAFAIYGFVVGA